MEDLTLEVMLQESAATAVVEMVVIITVIMELLDLPTLEVGEEQVIGILVEKMEDLEL